jgi:hypothetical protein
MRQRASTDGWPTAQRTGISGSKTKWPVYTQRFAESSTGVDNWAIRRQLTEKRANRGFGCAGTETSRGTTDMAAYRSFFSLLPYGQGRAAIIGGMGCSRQLSSTRPTESNSPDEPISCVLTRNRRAAGCARLKCLWVRVYNKAAYKIIGAQSSTMSLSDMTPL